MPSSEVEQLAQLLLGDNPLMLLETALVIGLSFAIGIIMLPGLIRKMRQGGMVGRDVNKPTKPEVAELGGIAALFAFSISVSFVVGLNKLAGNVSEPPYLAAISAFFIAAVVGLIDDISNIPQRLKIVAVAFAALPLMLVHIGPEIVDLPFGASLDLQGNYYLAYWLLLVPIGVTGAANAMNMSAGYNGLESGQIAIASGALLAVGVTQGASESSLVIFAALIGCATSLYVFNRFPARVFVGDIGTLGMGAAYAAGVILGHLELYGIIAIAPAFYEASSTAYFGLKGKNGGRRHACHNPVLNGDGTIQPPRGAERYTLAYLLLSRRPMSERRLVATLLSFYAMCGALALALSVV